MSYTGYTPSRSPLITDQFAPADFRFPRLDGANVPGGLFKNALINGSFDHWQRGTTASGGLYGADRWTMGGTGTLNASRGAFSPAEAPSESPFYGRFSVSGHSTGNDFAAVVQRIESVRRFAGKRVVVRGLARRVSGAGNVAVELGQEFGFGGSQVRVVYVGTIALTTVFTPFSMAVTIPPIADATIGSSDFLVLNLWLSSGSVYNARTRNLGLQTIGVDFADVEVREVIPGYGDQLGPFERVPVDIELLRCQRFYQVNGLTLYRTLNGGNFQGGITSIRFPVDMRAPPSGSILSVSGSLYNGGSPRPVVAADLAFAATDQRGSGILFNAPGTAGDYASMLLAYNAEL